MKRRFHRGTVFASLLVWQAGLALASQGSAFASMPDESVTGFAAHCHAPAHHSMAGGSSTTGTDTAVLSDDSGAKGQPECCTTDACKCGAAPGGLAMSNVAPRRFTTLKSPPARVPDAPPITQRASSPFRGPI